MPRETAGSGYIRGQLTFRVPIPAGTGAVEFITDLAAGFRFTVEKVIAFVEVAGTGAGATRTFRLLKGASTVVATGAIALADTATVGAQKALTVTAADAKFLDADLLTLDVASGGTAFTAGVLTFIVQYRQRRQIK